LSDFLDVRPPIGTAAINETLSPQPPILLLRLPYRLSGAKGVPTAYGDPEQTCRWMAGSLIRDVFQATSAGRPRRNKCAGLMFERAD